LPIVLIGGGIAWIAMSGAVGRHRSGSDHLDSARDWSKTAATAQDLASEGAESNAARRVRQAAEGWVDDARDAANEAGETVRETASDLGDRVGTVYDETIGRARDAAGAWVDHTRSAASDAGDSLREGARNVGERAANMYDQTVGGVRQVAGKAAEYGKAARHAIEPNGTLMNFCREQPMLVAGVGLAIGAAIGAMLPASRVETRIMGGTSQKVRQRVSDVATETFQSVTESGDSGQKEEDSGEKDASGEKVESGRKSAEPRDNEHRTNGDASPSGTWSTGDSVDEVERGVPQGSSRSNTESAPQSTAPYVEAASSADFRLNDTKQRD
jgi:hypothetical protein